MNCPFYGQALWPLFEQTSDGGVLVPGKPFMLVDTQGNQCALVVASHAPCQLEIEQKPIEWSDCPRVEELKR